MYNSLFGCGYALYTLFPLSKLFVMFSSLLHKVVKICKINQQFRYATAAMMYAR